MLSCWRWAFKQNRLWREPCGSFSKSAPGDILNKDGLSAGKGSREKVHTDKAKFCELTLDLPWETLTPK